MTEGRKMKDIMAPEAIDHLRRVFGPDEDMAHGGIIPGAKDTETEAGEAIVSLEVERKKFMQLIQEKERQHEARRAVIMGTGRRNGKDLDTVIVAAAMAAGIDPYSEDFADLIHRVSEKLKEVAVAIHDLVDVVVAAINEAWQPVKDAWEEIQKLMEQYEDVDEPEEEDRHDGAVEALVTWLLPVPTLYELYGQGVDHGGPGPSRLTLTRVTDDGLRRAETGRNRKGEHAMIIFTNVLLGIAAGTLFLGVIGEKDKEKHRDVTLCFVATMATIVLLNALA